MKKTAFTLILALLLTASLTVFAAPHDRGPAGGPHGGFSWSDAESDDTLTNETDEASDDEIADADSDESDEAAVEAVDEFTDDEDGVDETADEADASLSEDPATRRAYAWGHYSKEEREQYREAEKAIDGQFPDGKTLEPGSVRVRNGWVKFDTPPVIRGGRTLVPARAIAEALGAKVEWFPDQGEFGTVVITKTTTSSAISVTTGSAIDVTTDSAIDATTTSSIQVTIVLGSKTATVVTNDGEPVSHDLSDGMAGRVNGRTYVPLRFLAEVFGLEVNFDPDSSTVDIREAGDPADDEAIGSGSGDDADSDAMDDSAAPPSGSGWGRHGRRR